MPIDDTHLRLAVGLGVWAGTFFPLRRMLRGVIERRPGLLAIGLSAPLGLAALTAWQADPWYRYGFLAICLNFVALYVAIVSLERAKARWS